jgi:hypothetical protein
MSAATPENTPDSGADDKPLILSPVFAASKNVASDLLIRAHVYNVDGLKRCSFLRERIERIIECEKESASVILLKDGGRVHVAMPLDALEEKIFLAGQKETILDLRQVTAPPGKPMMTTRSVEEFNKSAQKAEKPVAVPKDVPLKLAFFAGGELSVKTPALFILEEKQIEWGDVKDADSNKTLIPLSDSKLNKLADSRWIYLDLPLTEFMGYYTQAKAAGYAVLDLRERTMIKQDNKGKAVKLMPEPPSGKL